MTQSHSQPTRILVSQQKYSSENIERAADQSSDFGDIVDDEPRGPRRSSRSPPGVPQRYRTVAGRAYAGIVQAMVWLGMAIVMAAPAPSTAHLMTSVAVSTDAYLEKNPKWEKAAKSSASGQWLQADREERAQHQAKGTFEFVPGGRRSLPPGTMVLPIKRVCRLKDTGAFKVRWTIEGNFDPYDGETFAPTACKKIVWLLYAVAILLALHMRWFDIKGAFMAERPGRDVYVQIDNDVYKLLWSIYGTKEAAHLFHDGLVDHLKAGGYKQSIWDQCLFVKWVSLFSFIYIVFHVDDFAALGSTDGMIDEFGEHLRSKYEITPNTDGVFLGTRCSRQPDGSMIFTKPHQLEAIFDKWTPDGSTIELPKEPMAAAYIEKLEAESPPVDKTPYKSLLGALMQLMDCRPDISYALSKLAQRSESPREHDMSALLYVVHYLIGTKDLGLRLRPGDSASAKTAVLLRAYADASCASHLNGRSQYCICFDLVPSTLSSAFKTGMFYFKSWMAPSVDLSSTEAEIGTIVECAKDVVYYRGVMAELHLDQVEPTPLYNDNKSAITLATRYSGQNKRVRYMMTKINWLMEKTREQVYNLVYMASDMLPADFGTKRLQPSTFQSLRSRVLGS